ncbi:hypothetical protein N1851_015919 [Merluccius polli]|uniref:Uncharacterized protein n=1 Tax=Merluccius polli TaxID=89951 RepID=A0AA47MSB4_MERPO|nr:hypothetical protein N1851_015919 [Merluccius polli]
MCRFSCNPSNLLYPMLLTCTELEAMGGDSGSAKTWITPENTATSAALTAAYSFSHNPRPSGRGGAGLLVVLPGLFPAPLDYILILIAVSATIPIKLNIALIYYPSSPLHDFLNKMDALLSCQLPEDSTPLVVLGDFQHPARKVALT